MEIQRMKALVDALGMAKSNQNVVEAMQYQHDEMVLKTPAFNASAKGKEANAKALEGFFAWFPDYSVEIIGAASDGEIYTIWGEVSLTWTGERFGLKPNGNTAKIDAFMQFTFKDDLIASELFFIDLADLCSQSGISIDTVHSALFQSN